MFVNDDTGILDRPGHLHIYWLKVFFEHLRRYHRRCLQAEVFRETGEEIEIEYVHEEKFGNKILSLGGPEPPPE